MREVKPESPYSFMTWCLGTEENLTLITFTCNWQNDLD